MTSINLIPTYRRIARIRRRLIRRWVVLCAGYLVILAVAYPVFRMAFAHDESPFARLASVQRENGASAARIEQLKAEHAETSLTLEATRRVGNQVDWSYLLTLLSTELKGSIVLKECTLLPQSGSVQPESGATARARSQTAPAPAPGMGDNPAASTERVVIELVGYGRTQLDVSQFVLRLERIKLFDRVTLEESRREGYLTDRAIAFRLRCEMSGGKGGGS